MHIHPNKPYYLTLYRCSPQIYVGYGAIKLKTCQHDHPKQFHFSFVLICIYFLRRLFKSTFLSRYCLAKQANLWIFVVYSVRNSQLPAMPNIIELYWRNCFRNKIRSVQSRVCRCLRRKFYWHIIDLCLQIIFYKEMIAS